MGRAEPAARERAVKGLTYGTARFLYAAYLAAIFVTLAVLDVYLLGAVLAMSVAFAGVEHLIEHLVERRRLRLRRLATALELEGDATIGAGRPRRD